MDKNTKEYLVKFFSAMAVYLVLVYAAKQGVKMTKSTVLQHALAVAPIVPVLFAVKILVNYIRKLDEVQRAIVTEAAVISLLFVGFGALTYGFLESFLDYPAISVSWVLPANAFAYGLATFVVRRKYL